MPTIPISTTRRPSSRRWNAPAAPAAPAGCWPFQYRKAPSPLSAPTAAAVMAMHRARRDFAAGDGYDKAIDRGVEWTAGMQSRNGGWAAFDVDNVDLYLNNIPFADH